MGEVRPRQRKFAPRSRTGCKTCRARRKRCDGQRPECLNCTRLNMKCEWEAPRRIVPDSAPHIETSTPEQGILSLGTRLDPWEILPGNPATEREHLLSYYVEGFVPSISVATTPSSFYTNLYIPMAFQSEGILDAILAMSSSQLAKRSTDPERARHLQDVSYKHQAKCHLYLKDRISPSGKPLKDTYPVIGIILHLVGLEALNGTTSTKWLSQMNCVRRILGGLYAQPHTMESWELASLRRHFTYHDVMASLMEGVVETGKRSSSDTDFSVLHSPSVSSEIDPLMGISYYLCALICRIQYVTTPNPAFPHVTQAAFISLENDIQMWTYDSPLMSPNIDTPLALDLIALAECYRLAALIQLYRTSDSHKVLVPACASRAMQFIIRIPPGSPAESSLLYPLFLAAAELEDEEERMKCDQRLTAIQNRNRYGNVSNVQKVLREVWKPLAAGTVRRDWEDVLKELGWSFTLG
ncbi:putative Zn(II)2Cys6 transcription factor-like protein [Amniculicola lignicola CBS 123094]|uniref:Putative Zn(II)2Cys6 transcription factor-like protein n=1 Tax=Amniculicola lignicola CBS 123094 TaxID=1392246 RepID=A0A6A5W873_9PLEO|nr:putative Zn(II)2Cys6 transcription factor-like protein [Amniculicola lignicola CBS 123094]